MSSVLSLSAEVRAVEYIHDEVQSGRQIPMAEVDGVVRAIAVTIRGEQGMLLPLLDIRHVDQYGTSHSCNVTMLAVGLSDQLGLSDADARAIGTAALLHDIGNTRIPGDLLTKAGALTPEERLVMQTHPVEGARILATLSRGNSLAATVAYEHHIWASGAGGYPHMRYPREVHFASRLVQVCDIYDALTSLRPYRDPLPQGEALDVLKSLSGVELDPSLVEALLTMAAGATEIRGWIS